MCLKYYPYPLLRIIILLQNLAMLDFSPKLILHLVFAKYPFNPSVARSLYFVRLNQLWIFIFSIESHAIWTCKCPSDVPEAYERYSGRIDR